MKKSYYLFNPGRISRKDNTLKFTATDEEGNEAPARYLPVETVDNLYAFGALDANSALYNFLGQQGISVHFFDYYEHYTGSFMPRDYLLAGRLLIAQASAHSDKRKRIVIARKFIEGASFNILKNLRYYSNREKDTSSYVDQIEQLTTSIADTTDVDTLMGIEGNIRQCYYEAFPAIIPGWEMGGRSKQPPANEVNAMISFVNSMCYTLCLDAIYHTQLHPTISYLHVPGERRFSLALDISEIFKPILVDRLIFSLLNKKQIQASDFDLKVAGCRLTDAGRKKVVRAWDEKLAETIKHRNLGRNVSYRHLVRLECYKLVKHVMGIDEYKPFKAWW